MRMQENIGERIAKARRNSRRSQKQLAEIIHVEPNTISAYESGTRRPSLDVVVLLAKALHVSTDYLILGEEKSYIDTSELEGRDSEILWELTEVLREKNRRIKAFRGKNR